MQAEAAAHVPTLEAHWGGGAAPFGATWQKTMMWIFIVTDGLLFSGLLCGYGFVCHVSPVPWPHQSEVFSIPFIALMTFILITSSMTMGTAVTAARLGDRRRAINNLIFTGCTTSVCVDSTIRDAMFRDYRCVLLADCTGEPIGGDLARSNHEASLLTIQTLFGWVSSSEWFLSAIEASAPAATASQR